MRVTLKFETKILRSDIFAQVNLMSAAPTLQNLRIDLTKRQSGKSKVPAKQRGSWPKVYSKLKEQERAAFFSPSENRCLSASNLKPEEREFVVDSGASMHMISNKDLSDTETDALTKSCSPTIVITANGEVQTHEEATVYVKELDIFLTMKVLDNTPAVLSLGKLCDETDIPMSGSMVKNPHLIQNRIRIPCNTENFVPIVVPGLSSSSSGSSSTSKTPSWQESHCSSSSSTSSSSLSVSEIQTREREDRTESDISPVTVSTTVEHRSGRTDDTQANQTPKPNKKASKKEQWIVVFWDPGVAARISGNIGGWWNSSTRRFSRQFFSWSVFRAHIQETWGSGVSTVFILISLKTEIARSAKGPKLQWPVQKTQWRNRTSCWEILVTW